MTSPELTEHGEVTISYSGIPTTEEQRARVKLPPIGVIPVWQDNEILH